VVRDVMNVFKLHSQEKKSNEFNQKVTRRKK
jgi:hypothetical protein